MGRISRKITWAELKSRADKLLSESSGVHAIACGGGLFLRTFGSSLRCRAYWYARENGNFVRIGDYPRMSLADARLNLEKRQAGAVRAGEPAPSPAGGPAFGELAAEWLESKKRLARFANIRKCVDYLKPLDGIPVRQISNVKAKEALLSQEITPYKLREVLATLCSILDLAIENGIIDSHPCSILKKSPAFPKPGPTDGFKFVPWQELGTLFSRLEAAPLLYRQYFLLLCLSCLRPGECRQLEFSWLNAGEKCLCVPGSIMKVKRAGAFRVPVTGAMRCLIKGIRQRAGGSKYMFERKSGGAPIAERDLSVIFSALCGGLAHPHGFRKTARSFFAEHGVALDVAAMCLDHRLNTGADAVYQKSDMLELRRAAMEEYSNAVMDAVPLAFREMMVE